MFPFEISDAKIQREVNESITYHRGYMYYLKGYVHYFEFDERNLQIRAVVSGSSEYNINVYFKQDGTVDSYDCTCPAFRQYGGLVNTLLQC